MLFTPEPGLFHIAEALDKANYKVNPGKIIAYDKDKGILTMLCGFCHGAGEVFVPYNTECYVCWGKKFLHVELPEDVRKNVISGLGQENA
jgi:hypothetical protein